MEETSSRQVEDRNPQTTAVPTVLLRARELLGLPVKDRDLADELIRDRQKEADRE